jgi:predicted DsbA family dithiol-disulfide isomerase
MTKSERPITRLRVSYDYTCPYVNATVAWLREVQAKAAETIEIEWRYFSLEQVNQRAGDGVNVWDRPAGYQTSGLEAFAAAEAARRQENPEAWDRLHAGLFRARHSGQTEQLTRAVVERVAEEAGLDMARFRRDMDDPTILDTLKRDHADAAAEGVFGTPTFFFENGGSGFLKMMPAPTGAEALRTWEHVKALIGTVETVAEIKRPKKPQPI